jgi:hypothetical protein
MAGSQSEVYDIVRSMGPPSGTSVAQWVAKAGQESSFRRDVVNSIGCVGYWQICPTNFGWLGVTSAQLKASGRTQFAATKRIYARQGWAAWNATGGKPSVSDIAEHAGRSTSLTSPQDLLAGAEGLAGMIPEVWNPLGAFQAVLDVVNRIGTWVSDPHNWTRVSYVAGGTLLVIVAGAAVASETRAGQALVGSTVAGKTGKALKR